MSSSTPRSWHWSCARAFVGHGPDARGGVLRPRRRAALDLPPGDAAAARARDPRGRPARVHVLVRRLRHVVLRLRRRDDDASAAHLLLAPLRRLADRERDRGDDPRAHARRDRRRIPRPRGTQQYGRRGCRSRASNRKEPTWQRPSAPSRTSSAATGSSRPARASARSSRPSPARRSPRSPDASAGGRRARGPAARDAAARLGSALGVGARDDLPRDRRPDRRAPGGLRARALARAGQAVRGRGASRHRGDGRELPHRGRGREADGVRRSSPRRTSTSGSSPSASRTASTRRSRPGTSRR